METTQIKIIDYNDEYAEKLSEIIIRNLREINQKDYSKEKIEELVLKFQPDKIIELSKDRKIYVAVIDEVIVGTLSVAKSWDAIDGSYVFLTIFVLPEYHQKGVGRKLIQLGEEYVRIINGNKITIPSSITSHVFYNKMGYDYLNGNLEPDLHGCIPMVKSW